MDMEWLCSCCGQSQAKAKWWHAHQVDGTTHWLCEACDRFARKDAVRDSKQRYGEGWLEGYELQHMREHYYREYAEFIKSRVRPPTEKEVQMTTEEDDV